MVLRTAAFILSAVAMLAASDAFGQQLGSIAVGPFAIHSNISGVDVVTNVHADVSSSGPGQIAIHLLADLGDLQAKIGAVIDRQPLPRDNCASFSPNNVVIDLPSKALTASGNAAVLSLSGTATLWGCLQIPFSSPAKTILATQPFQATLPANLMLAPPLPYAWCSASRTSRCRANLPP
jgi:hypothetical protein